MKPELSVDGDLITIWDRDGDAIELTRADLTHLLPELMETLKQ